VSKTYYVYIMASQKNGTTYTGVTNDIILRSTNHRDGKGSLFTKRHRVQRLVYYEEYADVRDAITREKQLKKWNRRWKINLIEKANPEWRDLWFDLNR
jgi:putative endonuclease